MDWYPYAVFIGFAVFNLVGLGLYHNNWKIAEPELSWKSPKFFLMTLFCLVFGTAYCLVLPAEKIIDKIRGNK